MYTHLPRQLQSVFMDGFTSIDEAHYLNTQHFTTRIFLCPIYEPPYAYEQKISCIVLVRYSKVLSSGRRITI